MGGIVEARDRAEAPRGAGEAREERGSVSKGKTGKHGSGVEKTTKKRRKVNHGMLIRPPCCCFFLASLPVVAGLE